MSALVKDPRPGRIFLWVALPITFGLIAALIPPPGFSTQNQTPPPSKLASSTGRHFPLEISPDPIDLGIMRQGQSNAAKITLHNPSQQPVVVQRISTSCPCLHVVGQPLKLGPGESDTLAVGFQPSDEPDFRGRLSIEVIGRSIAGEVVLVTHVNVEVRAEPANQRMPSNVTVPETTDPVKVEQGGAQ